MRIVFLCAGLLLFAGCGHTLLVASTPSPANVYFLDEKGKRISLAGKTPLELSTPKQADNRYFLEIERTGFVPATIVVEQIHPFGSASSILVSLTEQNSEWFRDALVGAFSGEASSVISDFIELKTRISQQDDAEVKKLEKKMQAKYEKFSTYNALMGLYYFRKNNKPMAKKYLDKAVALNPQDASSKNLLAQMRSPSK